tara:strand:- start:1024 stop:1602 length:579 start_codon:yes stop_codon:yes gene_type:complete
MELVGAFSDRDKARAFAEQFFGRLLVDPRPETGHLPFAALVSVETDQAASFIEAADAGAFICVRRFIKPRLTTQADGEFLLPGKIAVFPMVKRSDLSHEQADGYWRDMHGPLALRVHEAMTFYTQLSIVHVIHGPRWDGIAQCGFDDIDDLRLRFYGSPAGQKEVEVDVRKFADPKRSPRRLICDEYLFSSD